LHRCRPTAARRRRADPKRGRPAKVTFCVRGVASPLLANIYLHYVFDLWAKRWREHHTHGQVIIVRYADDIVVGFEHALEAKRFLTDLQQRMEKFALSLHPDKTRLIEFGRFAAQNRARRGLGKPENFNYHAVPTNAQSLDAFRRHVMNLWQRTLKRRSQTDCTTWARMTDLATAFLPAVRILHPWPTARFAVNHPRWEPGA